MFEFVCARVFRLTLPPLPACVFVPFSPIFGVCTCVCALTLRDILFHCVSICLCCLCRTARCSSAMSKYRITRHGEQGKLINTKHTHADDDFLFRGVLPTTTTSMIWTRTCSPKPTSKTSSPFLIIAQACHTHTCRDMAR